MGCSRRSGPRTPSTTTDANLDCAFVKNSLLFALPKIESARPPLIPITYPLIEIMNSLNFQVEVVRSILIGLAAVVEEARMTRLIFEASVRMAEGLTQLWEPQKTSTLFLKGTSTTR